MIITDNDSGQAPKEARMTAEDNSGSSDTGTMFRLTLVRHGQTNHNRLCLVQGQMDTQLNDFGREQASLLARYLRRMGIRYDQVYSSDLSRAYETATIICTCDPKRHPSSIKLDPLLRERSYGKLQGLPMSTVRKMAPSSNMTPPDPNKTPALDSNGNKRVSWLPTSRIHRPEGGETLDEVRDRVEAFCDRVLLPNAGHQQHILVVSHGGTIREFLKQFKYKYEAPIEYRDLLMTPNTGVNEFDIWLNGDKKIVQIRPNYLHELPHLTFDVWNRDNPHVNLNNLHLRTPTEFDEKHKNKDLKLSQSPQLVRANLSAPPPGFAPSTTGVASASSTTITNSANSMPLQPQRAPARSHPPHSS